METEVKSSLNRKSETIPADVLLNILLAMHTKLLKSCQLLYPYSSESEIGYVKQ